MTRDLEVASAFLLQGDKTYVSRRSDRVAFAGLIQNPGGKIDPGETPRQAVVREIAEETGLKLPPERFVSLCQTRVELGNGRRARVHTFVVHLAPGEIPRMIEYDKQGPWMPLGIDMLCRCPLGFTPAMATVFPHLQAFISARVVSFPA
ncbi:MAG: NUDIX hydrolase [Opitutaceae bacterium]|nr:NUDIX hydrolase [Opitutaceae bacterium]